MLTKLLVVAGAGLSHAWTTKSQAYMGASVQDIRAQMEGAPRPIGLHAQAELSMLWTYNPTAETEKEQLRGLGGGITWAWNPKLCDKLMPAFLESRSMSFLLECDQLKAAVRRAFSKWEASSRYIKMVDMTAECDKYNINSGPPTDPPWGYMLQDPGADFHGGCPLAEVWVTPMDDGTGYGESGSASGSGRRALMQAEALEDPHGAVEPLPERRLSEAFYSYDMFNGNDNENASSLTSLTGDNQKLSGSSAVATARSNLRFTTEFRFTNGDRPHYVDANGNKDYNRLFVEAYAGTLSIATHGDICWYLDSAFCATFHTFKSSMGVDSARLTLLIICIAFPAIFGIIGLLRMWFIFRACFGLTRNYKSKELEKKHSKEHHDAHTLAERAAELEEELEDDCARALEQASKTNPIMFTAIVAFIVIPPLFFSEIARPCWDCYDFEAAILHEMGHLFGLSHPDNIPQGLKSSNLAQYNPNPQPENVYQEFIAAGGRINASNCHTLWDHVHGGVPDGLLDEEKKEGVLGYEVRNSVMEAFTQHNPLPCLQDDDVEGILTLYPDCTWTSMSHNICLHAYHNIGFVRVMFFVCLPLLTSLLFVMLCVSCLSKYEVDELEHAREALEQRELDNEELAARFQSLQRKSVTKASPKSGFKGLAKKVKLTTVFGGDAPSSVSVSTSSAAGPSIKKGGLSGFAGIAAAAKAAKAADEGTAEPAAKPSGWA